MALLLLILLLRKRQRRLRSGRVRREWVRSILRRRRLQGDFHNLLQELRSADPESHFRYLRMSRETFDNLLILVCLVVFLAFFFFLAFENLEKF